MLYLIIFMLASFSMASIIVDQKIFEEPREWIKSCSASHPSYFTKKLCQLVSCHFCTGFWSGVFLVVFVLNPFNFGVFDFFLGGLIGALSAYYINAVCRSLIIYLVARFDIDD